MTYLIFAECILLIHFIFIIFAALGAILVLIRNKIAWLHVPTVIWATLIEFTGWICPLTPLENWLRFQGGESGYSSGFIEYYIHPLLYPEMLTRNGQLLLGILLLGFNVIIYLRVFSRRGEDRVQ
jgi:hypothetical protein